MIWNPTPPPVRCRMCLQAADDRVAWLHFTSLVLQAEGKLEQAEARRLAGVLFDGPSALGAAAHTWSARGRFVP